ncbi:serine/threonine-protein phosphatase [Streptomyces sp. HNM0663]|uniref:Serine/threonine-protein phosphatase n=1 Tax=Streptomyces chengmaiensis TaxID=3040919 RepID=A0ABT6HVL9_9ACTN|nr:serine/threonine-protein phosphatase [Streptomyces chengmaiensis]MDH2392372.1 serine/threonine-protein phosphatase [Streptomyces chengmaiensis]
MNFTRWSARLPGTQRRAAARRTDHGRSPARRGEGSVPAARGEYTRQPEAPPDAPALDDFSVSEMLGRLPALVALVYGPEHRVAYVNDAYAAVFGPRQAGTAAAESCPELAELGLLPLMDQVLRSGRPRTVKSRKVRGHGSYTITCLPAEHSGDAAAPHTGPVVDGTDSPLGTTGGERADGAGNVAGVLVFAADVTDQAEAAERLRASERRHRETAVTLQRSLLPQELEQPDDLRIAATYQPGGTDAAVGGDWYDVITLGAGRTALVIGDVMGRGVRAAAVMGQLRTAVRAYARLDLPPHEVLQLLDGLASEIDPSQIATCVYAVHDPNEGRLVYASAGHLPVLVRDEDGTVLRAEEPTGPPLGTGGWLHTSGSIALPPGASAVLYTDGLVERRGEDIDKGVAALECALAGATGGPQVVCDRLIRALGVTADHDDDVAVLVVQHPTRTGGDAELFHNAALDLLGGVEAAPRARAFASGVLASWRFSPELHDLGVLAASELVANSLKHGTPPMRLRLRRTDRRLTIEVTDGDDHLPRRRRAETEDEAGRGISIIATIASSWGSRRTPGGGKAVWCEFALPR